MNDQAIETAIHNRIERRLRLMEKGEWIAIIEFAADVRSLLRRAAQASEPVCEQCKPQNPDRIAISQLRAWVRPLHERCVAAGYEGIEPALDALLPPTRKAAE